MDMSDPSRREFLRKTACAAVGYGAMSSAVLDLCTMSALAQSGGYKALVCVFLFGGNDANNMLVPLAGSDYTAYAAARGAIALPQATLLPLAVQNANGRAYAFHPSLAALQPLFDQGRVAALCNTGPLVAPLTRAEYLARTKAVPRALFSHSDQQIIWQTSVPDGQVATGWGGRMADLLYPLNGNNSVSMSISIGGTNRFQVGETVFQYQVGTSGPVSLSNYQAPPSTQAESRAIDRILARQYPNVFESEYRAVTRTAIDNDLRLRGALASAPALATVFPTTRLASQLRMVARLIQIRASLGVSRQVYFCSSGGYDTHGDQLVDQSALLRELGDAMAAFYAATIELGVAQDVTTFTASDFGRTLATNGVGSDHGWGNHHLVMGGSVRGANLYGHFPTLAINGPDDTGLGRWIPTTSVDEYGATLAKWFGVAASDMTLAFPNIGRFAAPDLGFMA